MAVYELQNQRISLKVHSMGAELKSLKRVDTGDEYLWQADPAFWGRTAPILFPFVGSVNGKQYRTDGKTYSMGQHGFARDMEFALLSQTEEEIWFELRDDEETRKNYPFAFVLRVGYRLLVSGVEVRWQVENPCAENLPERNLSGKNFPGKNFPEKNFPGKELLFSIGAHPAFNCPLKNALRQEKKTDYFLKFGGIDSFESTRIRKGLVTEEKGTYPLNDGYLPVTENLFDCDTLLLENYQTREVSLCRADRSPYVTVTMDAPVWGIWSPSPRAPFICIEPWFGRCDREGFSGELKEREWGNRVSPGEKFETSYNIMIG